MTADASCQATFEPWSRRSALLTLGVTPSSQKGLEFGALDNPVVRRHQGDIRFVDYTTTEGLRAHPHAATIDKSAIVDVDYVWCGTGSLAEVIKTGELFDYAIASHVVEHVPNLVGWLQGIAEVLRPGGVFNLAIPDKRYTFDARRKVSTLGEVVEAYLLGFRYPSIRQMFDHCYDAVAVEPGAVWKSKIDLKSLPRLCGDVALQLAFDQSAEIVRNGRYIDSHCLIVTPGSFLDLLEGLSRLGLAPFVLREMHPTEVGDFEFFVSFEKADAPAGAALRERQLAMIEAHRNKIAFASHCAGLAAEEG